MSGLPKPSSATKNPFARPREKEETKKTIRTYNNPFAAKSKNLNQEGITMHDIVNEDDENLRLKKEDRLRQDIQRARPQTPKQNAFQRPSNPSGQNQFSGANQQNHKPINLAQDLFGGNPLAQVGIDYTKGLVENTMGNLQRNSTGWAAKFFNGSIKDYFQIDNSYLSRKLKHLFAPFLTKNIPEIGQGNDETFQAEEGTQELSVFKTDLYIPFMSFITYILLTCLYMGLEEKFKPELIFKNISNCSLLSLFETLVLKIGLMVADDHNISFFDMMSLTGYKYVGLCFYVILYMLKSLTVVSVIIYPFQLYICACSFFNMYMTLKNFRNQLQGHAFSSITQLSGKQRLINLCLGGLQILFTWILLMVAF